MFRNFWVAAELKRGLTPTNTIAGYYVFRNFWVAAELKLVPKAYTRVGTRVFRNFWVAAELKQAEWFTEGMPAAGCSATFGLRLN